MGDQRPLADPATVSAHIGVPEATLRQWRYLHTGPRYIRVGRYVRYRWSDIERWLDQRSNGGDRDLMPGGTAGHRAALPASTGEDAPPPGEEINT